MKIKTSELTGPALDWAVAKASERTTPPGQFICLTPDEVFKEL